MVGHAGDEVVKITVEDHPRKKFPLRWAHAVARNPRSTQFLTDKERGDLPFTHIIDAPAFEDKRESPLLQLADACTFCLKRALVRGLEAGKSRNVLSLKLTGHVEERFLTPLIDQVVLPS